MRHYRPCHDDPDAWFDFDQPAQTAAERRLANEKKAAARRACWTCPDFRSGECAYRALQVDDTQGIWSGVWLPPLTAGRRAEQRDAALRRLQEMAARYTAVDVA